MANPIRICSSLSLQTRAVTFFVTAVYMFFAVAKSAPAKTTCGVAMGESCAQKRGMSLLQVDPGHGQQVRSLVAVNVDPVQEPGPALPAELGDDLASIPVPAPEPPPQAESDDSLTSAMNGILSGQDVNASSVMDGMLSGHRTSGNASEQENTSGEAIINFTDAVVNETIVALGGDNATKGKNISELAPGPPPPVLEEAPYSNISTTSQEIVMEPINDAKPLPTLAPESVSGALLDCILDDWTEWTDCQTPETEGMKDTAQNRYRQVVQPWNEGGKPCGPTSEVQRCRVFSIASQLVHTDIELPS